MKIISSIIKNSKLIVTLDDASSVTKIYLDSVLNYKNIHSTEDDAHNYVITQPQHESNVITLDIADYNETSFIVTVIGDTNEHDIAYDASDLYAHKINMLTQFCQTCLDKLQKEKLLLLHFKLQLFEYAKSNSLTEDAINYYIDICRLLDIPLNKTCCKYDRVLNCVKCNACTNCENNYCRL